MMFSTLATQGAVVTWNAGTNGFWDVSANWVGGVIPTASDSVLIEGVGSLAKVRTMVNALHVSVLGDASLGIPPNGQLSINDSPEVGLYATGEVIVQSGGILLIEGSGFQGILMYNRLTNEGEIELRNCNTGIHFYTDTIANQGTIVISDPSTNGFVIFGGHLINDDSILIEDCLSGLLLITSATAAFSNSSFINIENSTSEGLSVRHHAVLSNEGEIIIDDFGLYGVLSYGSITNKGEIKITQVVSEGTAILIDSFNCCSDPLIGSIINTSSGKIYIDHAEIGIHLDPSTTFTNIGEIEVTDCTSMGLFLESRGIATMTMESTMSMSDVNDPMIVELEAILDVEEGAVLVADL